MENTSSEVAYSVFQTNNTTTLIMTSLMSTTIKQVLLVGGLCLMIFCVLFGNILILAAVRRHRPLQTPPVYLIASLAVADLMVGLMVMPLSLSVELTVEWTLGPVVCDFWIFLDVLCCTASILNLCVIALDRYWAITRPLEYKLKRTPSRMLVMIAAVWVISLLISATPLFGWRTKNTDPSQCVISQNRLYTVFSTFGAFFIPMTIMMVVYIRMFVEARKRIHGTHLVSTPLDSASLSSVRRPYAGEMSLRFASMMKRLSNSEPIIAEKESHNSMLELHVHVTPPRSNGQRRQSSPGLIAKPPIPTSPTSYSVSQTSILLSPVHQRTDSLSTHQQQSPQKNHLSVPSSPFIRQRLSQRRHLASCREQKAVKTLAIVTGTFLICWLPFFITALVLPFCAHCDLPSFWKSVFLWLGYFNSMINPILYTKFNKDFKDAFRKLLRCKTRNSPNRVLTLLPFKENGTRTLSNTSRLLKSDTKEPSKNTSGC
ncbi:5-hydroxytryptamine receptor 1A-like [Asterias amurensis]|uniref:5-hydroxytryptamine receptor 1A-like n=1 Tax=Asterias amurensis TaxID=7602 RepID=UPI003AB13264